MHSVQFKFNYKFFRTHQQYFYYDRRVPDIIKTNFNTLYKIKNMNMLGNDKT